MDSKGFLDVNVIAKIEKIIKLLEEAGYEPYSQIEGYIMLGDERYITRLGDARNLIREVEIEDLKKYIMKQ